MTESEVVAQTKGEEQQAITESMEEQPNNAGEITELEAKIIRQMEYYFGDMNLPRDRFLQEQIKLDDGWVPYTVMFTFNRLTKLTTDPKVINAALAKSDADLIEISEDGLKVRRNPEKPIPEHNEERRKELQARTIYVKGFPKETSTVDSCLQFFSAYDKVENVILRRYPDKATKKWMFKGSVFATFEKREQAEKFLAEESIKLEETELIKMWQEEYLKAKQVEYDSRKDKKNSKNKEKEDKPEETRTLPGGTVLHFSDCTDKMTRENIKEAIVNLGGEVAFIDFKIGDKEGWVRLQTENTAKDLFEKCKEGKLSVESDEISIELVEGDTEKEYLEKSVSEMLNRRKRQNAGKRGGRFGGNRNQSGGRHFDRKRKADAHGDAPAKKM